MNRLQSTFFWLWVDLTLQLHEAKIAVQFGLPLESIFLRTILIVKWVVYFLSGAYLLAACFDVATGYKIHASRWWLYAVQAIAILILFELRERFRKRVGMR